MTLAANGVADLYGFVGDFRLGTRPVRTSAPLALLT